MTLIATIPCLYCGLPGTVEADEGDVKNWIEGELIQVALPYLSIALREQLMTGYHPACWDKVFEGDDNE